MGRLLCRVYCRVDWSHGCIFVATYIYTFMYVCIFIIHTCGIVQHCQWNWMEPRNVTWWRHIFTFELILIWHAETPSNRTAHHHSVSHTFSQKCERARQRPFEKTNGMLVLGFFIKSSVIQQNLILNPDKTSRWTRSGEGHSAWLLFGITYPN